MNLKIFRNNPHLRKLPYQEIMATDITILNGIVKGEPTFTKGRKVSARYYMDKEQKDLAIEKVFSDELDSNNALIGLNMKIIWYDMQGQIGMEKEVYIPLSIAESVEIIIKRRKRQVNYLQEAGVRMGVKEYIDALFGHYSGYLKDGITLNLLNNYIENGTDELEQAIKSETNELYLQILSAKLPDGVTVKDSILYQIT